MCAESEFAVIGGGVVGLSIAYGLLKKGKSVTLFDEEDNAHRASRGNFGLVWVQGKGAGMPTYARWTRASARLWRHLADDLFEASGIDISLQQRGGYSIFLDEASLEQRVAIYTTLQEQLGEHYPFEVLGHNAIKKEEPQIGSEVAGAILHHEDGHLNPLNFYRALTQTTHRLGLERRLYKVSAITPEAQGFTIHSGLSETHRCDKVVLACGLGTAQLGRSLGFTVPIRPQRGQVLITEKMPRLINRPSDEIRQVNEGAVQIGASAEEVGYDDSETIPTTAALAANAIRQYPFLSKAQLVRSWGALRIMSPDGFPVYQQSESYPGAYYATCHSGITLAAVHAALIPDWLCGEVEQIKAHGIDLDDFKETRFDHAG
jgi:glycine/D-amino acid oxidase-like deaminating enzyme